MGGGAEKAAAILDSQPKMLVRRSETNKVSPSACLPHLKVSAFVAIPEASAFASQAGEHLIRKACHKQKLLCQLL